MGKSRLAVLDKQEIEEIHNAALSILSETGVMVGSEDALRLLSDAGAEIDFSRTIARLPEEMIAECLKRCPRSVLLAARNPKKDLTLPDGKSHATTDGCGVNVLDLSTGERRQSTRRDLADLTRLADYLEVVDVYWPMVVAGDVPEAVHEIVEFATSIENTAKHVQHEALSAEGAQAQVELASIIVGGKKELMRRPILSSVQAPVSPLQLEKGSIEAAMEFSRHGIPVASMSMVLCGASSPVYLASALAMSNAENLASICISQLAAPGAPVIYSISSGPIDMRTGSFACGSPELGILSAAGAQLAKFYGLPSLVAGMVTDANEVGAQAGGEKMGTCLMAALVGADLITGIGSIETDNCMSAPQMMIDSELFGYALRVTRGMEIGDEKICLEMIKRLGPAANYLKEPHTLRNFRSEFWMPELSERLSYEMWSKGHGKEMSERARIRALEILRTHHAEELPKDVKADFDRALESYKKRVLE